MVNRIWQHLFGIGLVETPDDFGKTGQPPSNPALLDHLASRFIAHGWSVKKLIAEIMSSRVYQLGTAHDAKAHEIDPANRLHWRMNRRRLDSDALLDAIRAISGDLVFERPAPAFPGAPNDNRVKSMDFKAWCAPTVNHRTIYQPLLRDRVPDEWSMFDFPGSGTRHRPARRDDGAHAGALHHEQPVHRGAVEENRRTAAQSRPMTMMC